MQNNETNCPDCGVVTEWYDEEDKIIQRGFHHYKIDHCPFYEPNTCSVCDNEIEDFDGAECPECDSCLDGEDD
jgi:hypothetical protein